MYVGFVGYSSTAFITMITEALEICIYDWGWTKTKTKEYRSFSMCFLNFLICYHFRSLTEQRDVFIPRAHSSVHLFKKRKEKKNPGYVAALHWNSKKENDIVKKKIEYCPRPFCTHTPPSHFFYLLMSLERERKKGKTFFLFFRIRDAVFSFLSFRHNVET